MVTGCQIDMYPTDPDPHLLLHLMRSICIQVPSKATGADLLDAIATHPNVNLLEKEYAHSVFIILYNVFIETQNTDNFPSLARVKWLKLS